MHFAFEIAKAYKSDSGEHFRAGYRVVNVPNLRGVLYNNITKMLQFM